LRDGVSTGVAEDGESFIERGSGNVDIHLGLAGEGGLRENVSGDEHGGLELVALRGKGSCVGVSDVSEVTTRLSGRGRTLVRS